MHAGAGGRGGAGEERLVQDTVGSGALPVSFQLPDRSLLFFPHFFFKIFFFGCGPFLKSLLNLLQTLLMLFLLWLYWS